MNIRATRPRHQRTTHPCLQRSARPRLQRTTRPRLQRSTRPLCQRTTRPHPQRTTRPRLQRAARPRLQRAARLHILAFRGLHILAFRELHVLTFRGLHVLAFRGLHDLTFRGLHVLPFRGLHTLAFRGLHVLAFRGLHVIAFIGLHALTFIGLHICTFRELKGSLPQDTQWTRRSPIGPWGIVPARHLVDPEKSNRVLGFLALITGLCQFYRVSVTPNKVIRPPINQAFIKKYCAPQAGAGRDTTAAWGWPAVGNRRTAATSRAPQLIYKGWSVAYDPWPTSRRPSPKPKVSKVLGP
ncbi:Dynein heavy chain [Glycine soja]